MSQLRSALSASPSRRMPDDAPEEQQWEVLTVNARPGAPFGIEFQEI